MLLVKCLRLSRNSKRWERQSNLWRTDNTIFFTMSIHDKKDNPSAVTLYTDTMCQGDTPWLQADWKKRPSLTLWPPRVRICNAFWLNGQKASAVLSSIIKPECDNKCCFERKLKILRVFVPLSGARMVQVWRLSCGREASWQVRFIRIGLPFVPLLFQLPLNPSHVFFSIFPPTESRRPFLSRSIYGHLKEKKKIKNWDRGRYFPLALRPTKP